MKQGRPKPILKGADQLTDRRRGDIQLRRRRRKALVPSTRLERTQGI